MKILQVIPTLSGNAGGPVEGLIQQGIEMVRSGHDVQTLSLDPLGTALDKRLKSSSIYMLGPHYLKYGFTLKLEPWLRENGTKFDVIIIHGMWSYHGYCVSKVARQLDIPYVIFLHGMLDPWFARQYALKHLKKWLYWPWAEYRTIRDAQLVLFTTSDELMLARQSFWLYKARERLVGYGIRKREIPPGQAREIFLARFPELLGKRCFLYLSRIHPKKGCDLLLLGFSKLAASDPNLHLIMAGPGDAGILSELEKLANQLGLQGRVTFTGMLTGDLKWGAFDSADVFVLPSHQENFGIAVAEALASGLPVLTTYQVNIWREIKEAGAGIICKDTQSGVHGVLLDWLALTSAERDAMRVAAVDCFKRYFEIQCVTQNLLDALALAARGDPGQYTYNWANRSLQKKIHP